MGDPRSPGISEPGGGRPDGLVDPRARNRIVAEVLILWVVTLVAIRLVVEVQRAAGLHEIVLAAVPILFMYAPVWLCNLRGVDSWDYPLALPAFRDTRPWIDAFRLNAVVIGVIIVPWIVGYHLWTTVIEAQLITWITGHVAHGHHFQGTLPTEAGLGPAFASWDVACRGYGLSAFAFKTELTAPVLGGLAIGAAFLRLIGYHLFFVAIPEEFFYRGYLQTRLDEAFGKPWRILGAELGPAWLLTSVIFAAGHSIVQVQWWHFAIFFPSLMFGWMRARTGQIVAGAFFHSWSNVTVSTLDTLYGVVAP